MNAYKRLLEISGRPAERIGCDEDDIRQLAAEIRAEENEACAKVCVDMQCKKNASRPDGAWLTLGSTEISGDTFAAAIRARMKEER